MVFQALVKKLLKTSRGEPLEHADRKYCIKNPAEMPFCLITNLNKRMNSHAQIPVSHDQIKIIGPILAYFSDCATI